MKLLSLSFLILISSLSTFAAIPNKGLINEVMTFNNGQTTDSALDILWVVDDSGSMQESQNVLLNQVNNFFTGLESKTQWKVALVTTDIARPLTFGFDQTGPINSQSNTPSVLFSDWLSKVGTSGSGTETPLDVVEKVTKEAPHFFRADANLAVIFVTDENDQSKISASALLDEIHKIKGANGKIAFYSILKATDLNCTSMNDPFKYEGSAFQTLTLQTSGEAFSLCQFDDEQSKKLGTDLAEMVGVSELRTFQLKEIPELTTLKLTYNNQELKQGIPGVGYWLYDFENNSIYFHDLSFLKAGIDT